MIHPQQQALAQLTALGFTPGTRFYGRALLPRELQGSAELRQQLGIKSKAVDFHCDVRDDGFSCTPYKWEETGELKADGTPKLKPVPDESRRKYNGFEYLTWLNQRGYGIYLTPNQGGRFNKDITACQSAYFESDDGDFDAQWQTIKQFEDVTNLAPSVVVKTRKSLHVYYRFIESDWSVEGWTDDIQRPLALAMKSDPAIQNTARLMRLAGFQHVKWNLDKQCFDFVPCTLEVCNDRQYSRQQVKDAIASILPQPYSHQRFKFWVYLSSPTHKAIGLELDPELARTCPDAELDETERRWRRFIKLSRDKANGKAVNPDDAFSIPLNKLPKVHKEYKYEGEVFEGDTNTIIWAKYLYGYNPIGRGDWITAQDPLIPESDRHFHSSDSLHIHKVTGAIKSHRGSDPKDIYERMREIASEGIWKELTELSVIPWKRVNTPQLNLEELNLERGAIYIIKSAKGTHKTNSLKPLVPQFENVLAWFNRVALGREECHRIGVDWKDDLKSFKGSIKVGFCSDSAYQFNPGLLRKDGLMLVDEADQVFDHNFGSTCNKDGKRPSILVALENQLGAVIAGNGMALFMSADITNRDVDYITALAPLGCPVRVIINDYQPTLGDIYFDTSDSPEGLVKDLLERLEEGEKCFIIDDTKDGIFGCKSIAEYVRKVHPEWVHEITEINSDTSGDITIIEYLKNINQASLKTRLLSVSPSVVSGLSIQNGHFTGIYGVANGVLTCTHFSQAIARNRGAELIKLWVAEKGIVFAADGSLFPEQIKAYYKRNYESNARHILAFGAKYDPLTDEFNSPHFELYCKNSAYRNLCMTNLRERMKQQLEDEGYIVEADIFWGKSEHTADCLKESWYELDIKHARAVADANILTDEQLFQLDESTVRPTPEQLLDLEKTFLYKNYGAELTDSMVFEHKIGEVLRGCAAMCLKDSKGRYRKQLEAFYLLQADEKEAIAKDLAGEYKQLENGTRFAGDLKWRTRQRKAREVLGLPKFLKPDETFKPVDYAPLSTKARKQAQSVKDALNLDVSKMSDGQIFGEFMAQIGLDLDKQWASDRTPKGRRYKTRKISAESWEYAQMYCQYKQSQHEENPVVIPDHPPVNIYSISIGGGDQAEPNTQPSVAVDSIPQNSAPKTETKTTEKQLEFQVQVTLVEPTLKPVEVPETSLLGCRAITQATQYSPGGEGVIVDDRGYSKSVEIKLDSGRVVFRSVDQYEVLPNDAPTNHQEIAVETDAAPQSVVAENPHLSPDHPPVNIYSKSTGGGDQAEQKTPYDVAVDSVPQISAPKNETKPTEKPQNIFAHSSPVELPKLTRQEEIEDVVSLLEFCECPVTTLAMLECVAEVPSDLVTDVWAVVPSEKISQMQQWAVDLLVDSDRILKDELFDNGLTTTQRVLKAFRTLPQKLKSAVWAVVPNWRREELRQWRTEMA